MHEGSWCILKWQPLNVQPQVGRFFYRLAEPDRKHFAPEIQAAPVLRWR